MAARLLSHQVADLCIGKPALRPLPATATVVDALSLLRRCSASGEPFLSVWTSSAAGEPSRCVGVISIVDVLCFLCREENIHCPAGALDSPISLLLQKSPELVKQLEPNSSFLEAVDIILDGAHSLIVPRRTRNTSNPKQKPGRQFCWITQEDLIRFFFNSINLFSAVTSDSIQSLNVIEDKILTVHYDDPALSALTTLSSSSTGQTAVAVVDNEGRLIGEISLNTLSYCDETVVPAVATLCAGDLMAYIDYGGPPEELVQLVKERLQERKLDGVLEFLEDDHSNSSASSVSSLPSSSSDDEVASLRHSGNSRRIVRGTEPIVCQPGSSLVAVMIQSLAHRLNYVWVVEEDYKVVGIVTFTSMLKVFQDRVSSFA